MNPRGWVHFWDITGSFWCLGLYLINALNIKVIARLIHPTVCGGGGVEAPVRTCCAGYMSIFFFGADWTTWSLISPSQKESKSSAGWTSATTPEPEMCADVCLFVHAQQCTWVKKECKNWRFASRRSPLSAGAHCAVASWFREAGCLKFEREPKSSRGGRI